MTALNLTGGIVSRNPFISSLSLEFLLSHEILTIMIGKDVMRQ
jgi:hypothetical protein